jgi:hypothetical protein
VYQETQYLTKFLCADIAICKVNDIQIISNQSIVCVKHIDSNKVIFSTNLRLPVTKNVEWMFSTRICDERVNLHGIITSRKILGTAHYEYTSRLVISEFERANLTRLVNDMICRLKLSSIQPSCNFCVKSTPEECFTKRL